MFVLSGLFFSLIIIYYQQTFLKLQCIYIAINFLQFYIKIINLFPNKDHFELKNTRIIKGYEEILLYEYLIYLNNKKYKVVSINYLANLNEDVKERIKNLNLLLHIEINNNQDNIKLEDIKPYLFLINLKKSKILDNGNNDNDNDNILWDFILKDLHIQNDSDSLTFYLNDNNLTETTINIKKLRSLKIDEIFRFKN